MYLNSNAQTLFPQFYILFVRCQHIQMMLYSSQNPMEILRTQCLTTCIDIQRENKYDAVNCKCRKNYGSTNLTNGILKSFNRLNSKKNRMIHSRYESSFPVVPRSSVRRTCRTILLNAEFNNSIANWRKNNLQKNDKWMRIGFISVIHRVT